MTLVISWHHDNPERLVAAGPLARDHGIIMVGTPKAIYWASFGKHSLSTMKLPPSSIFLYEPVFSAPVAKRWDTTKLIVSSLKFPLRESNKSFILSL